MKTPKEMTRERADTIVNDIAEGIDNKESRAELRQALIMYSDLLMDANVALSKIRFESALESLKSFLEPNEKTPNI
jgi:hypothetical protein